METRPRSSRQKSAKGRAGKISDSELQDLARNPSSLSNLASNYEALSRSAVGFSDASKVVARESSRQAWAPPVKQNLTSSSSRFHTNSPLPQNPTLPAHPPPQAFGRAEDHIHLEDLVKLRERFNQADSSADGGDTLDEEEFMAAFDKIFGLKGKNKEEMRIFFNKIDYNSDGYIDWDEFCTFMYLELHERDDAETRAKKVEFHYPATAVVHTPHKDSLCRIQHLTDGSLISCSMDGVVCIWTHEMEGKRIKKAEPSQTGKPKWVTDMAVCIPQSKILLITGDHEIQFYELVNFAPYCQLKKLEDVPLKVDFWYNPENHSNCIILIGDKGGCVTVIMLSNIQEAFKYWKLAPKGKDGMPTNSIDRLVSGTPGTKVYRWKLHSNWVAEVHYLPSLRCFVSCSADSTASLVLGSPSGSTPVDSLLRPLLRRATSYRLGVSGREGRPQGVLQARHRLSGDQRVYCVAKGVSTVDYCPKSNLIVTGSVDQLVRVWSPFITSKPVATLRGHEAPVFCVRLDSTNDRVYSIGNDNLIKVWHLVDHTCLRTVVPSKHKFTPTVEAFHFNPVKQQLVMGAEQLAILRLTTVGPKRNVVLSHKHPITGVRFSQCFNQIITTCDGSVVRVWDVTSGECAFEFSAAGDGGISSIDIDHSGRRLVTGGRNGTIKLWNYNNGYCIRTLDKCNSDEVTDIKFVSVNTNRYVMTVGWDRKVSLFADVTGSSQHIQKPIEAWSTATEYAHSEDILSIAFGAPHLMATASFDGEIIVWSMISCNVLSRLKAPHPTSTAAVSPPAFQGEEAVQKVLFLDRRAKSRVSATLVASGPAGFIHFWNIHDSSAPMGCFPASQGSSAVTTLAVDGTNSVLISGDMQGYVSLWNIKGYCTTSHALQPPKRITSWMAHTMKITCIELIEHWNVLVTGSTDCTVRLWTLEGHYIGTFGQGSQWRMGCPSTYQYPLPPSDILMDPIGVPSVLRGEETPIETGGGKGWNQKKDEWRPMRISRRELLDPMDVDSEEDMDERLKTYIKLDVPGRSQECSRNVGKRLRHFRVKSAQSVVSGSGVHSSLSCQPFTDEPRLLLSPPGTCTAD